MRGRVKTGRRGLTGNGRWSATAHVTESFDNLPDVQRGMK